MARAMAGTIQSGGGILLPQSRRLFVQRTASAFLATSSLVTAADAIRSNAYAQAGDPWGPFTPSTEEGRYLQLAYPASTVSGELPIAAHFTMWIPDGIETVRAVIVHQHGAGTTAGQFGATAAYDLHWQALAKKWDCALLGPSYHVLNEAIDLTPGGSELWFDPRHGSEKTFLRALGEFARMSGHAEIATVPWCLWGHSGGGIWSNVLSTLHPERVLVAFLRSGTATGFRTMPEFPQPQVPAAVYEIPTMVNFGMGERGRRPWDGSVATFQEYRAQGAPIGFAPDPRTEHYCGDSRYLAIPFLDACLQMRLTDWPNFLKPVDMSTAWLAVPFGDIAVPAAEYRGDPLKAAWLPNEAVAKIWMEYVRTGTVSVSSEPPTPTAVKVKAGAGGNEISWKAEVDLAGGLGGFIVFRDGNGIARLPTQIPPQLFGRPLFQGLSFHDTPWPPLPQMKYLDNSARPGAKHAYTVVALNSSDVRSRLSQSASVG